MLVLTVFIKVLDEPVELVTFCVQTRLQKALLQLRGINIAILRYLIKHPAEI